MEMTNIQNGRKLVLICLSIAFAFFITFFNFATKIAFAQNEEAETETPVDEPFDEGLFPEIPIPGEPAQEIPEEYGQQPSPSPTPTVPEGTAERIEGGEAGEGETRWGITITGALVLNYIFNDSKGFTVKYRWEVKGVANAATAIIRGDADINAESDGPLVKWATGECRLQVSIPKIPFELTFRQTDEEQSSIKLVFKRAINEDWQSKCSFTDAPGARFDTTGPPEAWLSKALEKAKPPLREIVAEIGKEETTTSFVIPKETINDPPIGSVEIEGTGVVTIKPGGE